MRETASLAPAEGDRYCAVNFFVSDDSSKTCNSWGIHCHAGVWPYLPVFQHGFYGFTTTWPLCVTVWRHLKTELERQLGDTAMGNIRKPAGSPYVGWHGSWTSSRDVDVDLSWFTPEDLEHLRAWLYNIVCVCVCVWLISQKRSSWARVLIWRIYLFSVLSTQWSQFDTAVSDFSPPSTRLSAPRMASPPTSPTHSDSSWYNGTMCSYSLSLEESSLQNTVHSNSDSYAFGELHMIWQLGPPFTSFCSEALEALVDTESSCISQQETFFPPQELSPGTWNLRKTSVHFQGRDQG